MPSERLAGAELNPLLWLPLRKGEVGWGSPLSQSDTAARFAN